MMVLIRYQWQSSCGVCNGIHPPCISILRFRNVIYRYARSLPEMCVARRDRYGSDRVWLRRTLYRYCFPGSPTLPGWRPLPSALGWRSAMHATAACDHPGVVLLGRCRSSLDCYRLAPIVLATSRRGFLRAYT